MYSSHSAPSSPTKGSFALHPKTAAWVNTAGTGSLEDFVVNFSRDRYANTNVVREAGARALCKSAQTDNVSVASVLVRMGAPLHYAGHRALRLAVEHGSLRVADLLLREGAHADVICPLTERSLLEIAIDANFEPMITLLLNRGAQPSTESFRRAVDKGHFSCASTLIDRPELVIETARYKAFAHTGPITGVL